MNVLDSSSDDDDMYINAASKLHALNRYKQNPKACDDEDDDDANPEEEDEEAVLVATPSENGNSLSNNKQAAEKNTPVVVSNDQIVSLESHVISSSDDEAVVAVVSDNGIRNNDTTPRRTTRNSNKRTSAIPPRVDEVINDSIEQELNKEDSFQFSQDEDESFVMIGSPSPTKKVNLDDYEVTVKVLWKSNKTEKFQVRMHETLQKVFKHFANLEGVSDDQIIITKKDKKISPFDSPSTIEWTVLDILDGGVVSAEVAKKSKGSSVNPTDVPENSVKIKIQTSDKRNLTIPMKNDESFEVLLKKCSEQLEIHETKIKLYFDGELIDTSETPDSLDIEEEACIDLKIIQ